MKGKSADSEQPTLAGGQIRGQAGGWGRPCNLSEGACPFPQLSYELSLFGGGGSQEAKRRRERGEPGGTVSL